MYDYKFQNPFFKGRRKGDVDKLICDNRKSYKTLKWKPKLSTLSNIIRDEKNWLSYISNKITKFSITMIVELQSDDLLKNTSKRKTFSHTLDFDVAKNHSKTIAKERSIIVNISEIIGEQVIRYLRSEYR